MTTPLTDRLITELEPTHAAIERMRAHLSEQFVDEPASPVAVELAPAHRRRSITVPNVRLGLAVAGAAAVALLIALSPFDGPSDGAGVGVLPAPTTARAALERAGAIAAKEQWVPLRADEYFHTMRTSFAPDVPFRKTDFRPLPARSNARLFSEERFIAPDGSGGWFMADAGPVVKPMTTSERIAVARQVMTSVAPLGSETGSFGVWTRRNGEYVKSDSNVAERPEKRRGSPSAQTDIWGATAAQIERLNDGTLAERTRLLDQLLSRRERSNVSWQAQPLPQGQYEETRRWFTAQVEVENAIKLLGSAPLSPVVRQALFDRLAKLPYATVEHDQADQLGRRGTKITLEWVLDEAVPGFTVPFEYLARESDLTAYARRIGQPVPDAGPQRIPAHRSIGRWYQTIILAPDAGEILQQEVYALWKPTAQMPKIDFTKGFPRSIEVQLRSPTFRAYDGTLFHVRERTKQMDEPLTAACKVTPEMCR